MSWGRGDLAQPAGGGGFRPTPAMENFPRAPVVLLYGASALALQQNKRPLRYTAWVSLQLHISPHRLVAGPRESADISPALEAQRYQNQLPFLGERPKGLDKFEKPQRH